MMIRRIASLALALLFTSFATAWAQQTDETVVFNAAESVDKGDYRGALEQLDALGDRSGVAAALRRRILTVRAGSLLGEGYFDAAIGPAREAVDGFGDLSPADRADGLLLIARIEVQRGDEASAALERARAAAIEADGPAGLRTLRVEDRSALILSTSQPVEAEKVIRSVIGRAEELPNAPQRDKLRFLNTLGITLLRQSKFGQAKDAFVVARNGRRELLSERHPETLESVHNLGVALRRLGATKEADAEFDEAFRLRSEILGPDHPDTLITRTMIVRQLIDKSDFETAASEAQAICTALIARVGESNVRTLEAMGDFANAQFASGRVSEGVETYRRSYSLATATLGETNPESMNIGHEYAGLLYRSGRYGEALSILQRVLTATRKIFDDENRDTIATLHSIAVVLSDLGMNDDAVVTYQYIASVLDKQVPKSHPNLLSVLNNLAAAYRAGGRNQEALKIIDDVVQIRSSVLGSENALTLVSRSNQAAILAALRRYAEATAAHRDIHSIRRAKLGDRHPDTLKALHNLASTLSEAGADGEAQPLFEKTLALRMEVLGARSVDTVTTMRDFAMLLERGGETERAKQLYLKIVDAAESLRAEGGLPDTLRRSYFATVSPAYKALAALEAKLGDFDQALRAAELSKARTLLEASMGRGVARSILSAGERAELSDIEFRIARMDERISSIADVGARADMQAQRNALSIKFAETNASLENKYPAYRQATSYGTVSAREAIGLIPADAALLDFVQTGSRTLVLWMTGSGERGSFTLSDNPNLSATLEAYRAAVAKPDGINGLRYPERPGATRYLVWKLPDESFQMRRLEDGALDGATIVRDIEPIRNVLSTWMFSSLPQEVLAAKRWFICPDGPLSLLPFDTLRSGDRLVGEAHDISFMQSITMLRVSGERTKQYSTLSRQPMLAIGNPKYAISPEAVQSQRAIDTLRGPTGGPLGNLTWSELPGTGKEMSALADLFDLKSGITLFSGVAASESTVRRLQASGELGGFRHVLFATHGYLDPQNPELSAIVLSQSQLRPDEDGYLRGPELASFDFRSDLVFVSACETGLGKWTSGEGILGLPFALQVGGNATTILTLWPILDDSSAEFVARFFAKVKDGVPFAVALAATKREFIRGDAGEQAKSPAVWAAFIYYGE
jgi:CHAT domain-containing protein/tetratricopeptide (TPR) repeat protein